MVQDASHLLHVIAVHDAQKGGGTATAAWCVAWACMIQSVCSCAKATECNNFQDDHSVYFSGMQTCSLLLHSAQAITVMTLSLGEATSPLAAF